MQMIWHWHSLGGCQILRTSLYQAGHTSKPYKNCTRCLLRLCATRSLRLVQLGDEARLVQLGDEARLVQLGAWLPRS